MATAAHNSRSAWYGPAPFGGKPPPIPQGWNPNTIPNWSKGFWQPNPYYNPANVAVTAQWMPAHAWGQNQQAPANFNPYKRVVKPPSAEYLATELLDNPLGLENMIPRYLPSLCPISLTPFRDQVYANQDEANAHTPWFWNPTALEEDDEKEAIITAVYRDKEGNNIGRESRGPAPTRQSSIDRPRDSPVDSRPGSSQARHLTEPLVSPQRNHVHPRYNSEPPPEMSIEKRNSIDRPGSASRRRDRSKSKDRRPSFQYGPSPPPSSASTTTSFISAVPTPPLSPPNDDYFTRQIPLRPTFSTAIIRTPDYYSNSPRRNSTSSNSGKTSTHPVQAHGSLDTMFTHHMHHLSVGEAHRASEFSSSSVSGGSSMSGASVFVDEPSSMLSPLIMSTPKPLTGRPLGRQHSAPTPLDAIPETSPIPPSQPPPPSASVPQSSRHVSPMSSRHVSPIAPVHEAYVSPPNSASIKHQFYSTSAVSTPSRTSPPNSASMRHPPRQSDYYSTASGSSSAPPSASISPTPTRPSPRNRRRKGFWNRRGDHLTSTGKIVYAPEDRAYPDELRNYPHERDGYRDEFGIFIGYLESRTELEESLPRHGRPPARPYESVCSILPSLPQQH